MLAEAYWWSSNCLRAPGLIEGDCFPALVYDITWCLSLHTYYDLCHLSTARYPPLCFSLIDLPHRTLLISSRLSLPNHPHNSTVIASFFWARIFFFRASTGRGFGRDLNNTCVHFIFVTLSSIITAKSQRLWSNRLVFLCLRLFIWAFEAWGLRTALHDIEHACRETTESMGRSWVKDAARIRLNAGQQCIIQHYLHTLATRNTRKNYMHVCI